MLPRPTAPKTPRRALFRRGALLLGAALVTGGGVFAATVRPSNDRNWSPDQAQLSTARFRGDTVDVQNVRNAHYRSTTDYDVRWEDRSYDLSRLESVWFMVEPFSGWRGPAHTLLSFGFSDGVFVAISVEVRKEMGESFSPLKGLLRRYELQYVVADERDLIGLRANHRRDSVYLYPVRTTPERMRELLVSMLERANTLAAAPEFYNTLTSTCTTNIVRHINVIAPGRVPRSFKVLLPAHADDLAYDIGLIDTELPRERFRAAHLINAQAEQYADSAGFSRGIRSSMPPVAPAAGTSR
jgi:hypothetical protein